MSDVTRALVEWQAALGSDCVLTDQAQLKSAETATFATDQKILAILKPANIDLLRQCLEIANRNEVAVYPISRGRNCGYGSRVPYDDGSVLLDLASLNQITHYDEDMACVTLQAGVTQEQLWTYLKEKGGRLWMDPISTFSDCSVIGNILERGHGMTAFADRISFATDYQVLLANGQILQTGFSAFPNARTAGMDRWAPGPNLEGLFSQSNFGIVTAMTLWLMPAPETVRALGFAIETSEQFGQAIEALRPLRLEGTLKWGPRFFNQYRLIETFAKYPWDVMKGQTPLSEKCLSQLKEDLEIPLWTGLVGFYGSPEQVQADEKRVRKVLHGFAQDLVSLERSSNSNSNPSSSEKANPQNVYEKFLHSNFKGMLGEVQAVTQRPRWRKKPGSVASSPDWSQDQCGIIWCPVSTPFRARDTLQAVELFCQVAAKYKLEPDMSVSSIRDRTLEINSSLIFDREDPEQEKNALACAKEYLARATEAGFYPHRVGLATSEFVFGKDTVASQVLEKIKALLDPQQILAPSKLKGRSGSVKNRRVVPDFQSIRDLDLD